ncbi:MAG: helix-turn-helix transcriptional regulator [Gemmataceae bacterium]|nr:helix-turn-helix transcriptional regulator [Gemmataceae bacterium]
MTATTTTLALLDNSAEQVLQYAAIQAASPIVLAFMECDEGLREEALLLLKQLQNGGLDESERIGTIALIAEILFPNADDKGIPGLDLEEAEAIARDRFPDSCDALSRMDEEEKHFAERLKFVMESKGITQVALAEKVGLGQPAISMMLNRTCRPQRKTILRFAEALDVKPEELWAKFDSTKGA